MTEEELVVKISAKANGLTNTINDVKSKVNGLEKNVTKSSTTMNNALGKLGSTIAKVFAVGIIVNFGKKCVDVASQASNAWIGLNSILTGKTGTADAFRNAQSFINEYIQDGLVPLNNAVTAYKNLALRGYSSDQIEKTMNALKNSATFARQSTYSLGEAVQTATEGLKNENSIVVDNAGVTKNVAKMWEDYAKSIGKTTNNLTQAEKIQAEVNGIQEETKFQMKDATLYADTYSGVLAKLSTSYINMKTAIGNVIQPLAKMFIPVITSAVNWVTNLFKAFSGLLSLFGFTSDLDTISSKISETAENGTTLTDSLEQAGDMAEESGEKAKKGLAGFDEITNLNDTASASSVSSSGTDTGLNLEPVDVAVEKTDNTLDTLSEKLKNTFSGINLQPLLTSLENIKIAFDPLKSDIFTGLQWGYNNVLVPLASWTITDLLPAFFNVLADTLTLVSSAIDECKPALSWLWDNFLLPIASWTGGAIISILEGLSTSLKFLSDHIGIVMDILVGLTTAWLGFKALGILGSVIQFVKYSGVLAGTSGMGAVLSAVTQLGTYLSGSLVGILGIAKGALTALLAPLTAVAGAIGISTGALLGIIAVIALVGVGIYELITNWDAVKNFFLTTVPAWWNTFKGMVATAWEGVKTWFSNLPYTIGELLGKVLATVVLFNVEIFNAFVTFFTETIPTKFEEFKTWLATFWDGIVTWAKEIPTKLKTFFTETIPAKFDELITYIQGLPAKFIEYGKNIVQGILDGITEGWANLTKKWGEFCDGFVDGFKEKLGIHSPSKVFAKMGGYITEGLEEGIGDGNGAFDGLDQLNGEKVEEIKENWVDIASWFKDNVTAPLEDVFETFSSNMTEIFEGISTMIKGEVLTGVAMMNVLIDCLQTCMNSVVRSVNRIISSINSTADETGVYLPYARTEQLERIPIPKLERGGIVDEATTFIAGEHGKEAIVPLEHNTEWIDNVASRVVTMMSAVHSLGNESVTINVPVELNGKEIASATIKDINLEAQRMGYKPILAT